MVVPALLGTKHISYPPCLDVFRSCPEGLARLILSQFPLSTTVQPAAALSAESPPSASFFCFYLSQVRECAARGIRARFRAAGVLRYRRREHPRRHCLPAFAGQRRVLSPILKLVLCPCVPLKVEQTFFCGSCRVVCQIPVPPKKSG